jgi:hypothetical protein
MVTILRLKAIRRGVAEGDLGTDQPYLLVGGRRVRGTQSQNDSEQKPLDQIPEAPLNYLVLSLGDQDSGFWDDDDLLGAWGVREGEAVQGEKEARFNGDGADYSVSYRALP